MKNVRIRGFSGPCFPPFGLNTERYSVSLRIQSKCGKIRTGKTPNANTFHLVNNDGGAIMKNTKYSIIVSNESHAVIKQMDVTD